MDIIDPSKVVEYLKDSLIVNLQYIKDALIFYLRKKDFFSTIFNKSKEDIVKQLLFYVAIFIFFGLVIKGSMASLMESTLIYLSNQFLIDIVPITLSVLITSYLFKVRFSFLDDWYKIILFLVYNYLFWGSLIALLNLLLENTENYQRDYFLYSLSVVVFFAIRHIFSGNIFFTGKRQIICFSIVNCLLFNIILLVLTTSDYISASKGSDIVVSNKIIVRNQELLEERKLVSKHSGIIDKNIVPFAKCEVIDSAGKAHSIYGFIDGIQKVDSNLFYSQNYDLTVKVIRQSKEYLDTLNKDIKTMKYKKNVKFFTVKRDIYKYIIDNMQSSDLDRIFGEGKPISAKIIHLNVLSDLNEMQNKLYQLKIEFVSETKSSQFPVLFLLKVYFFAANFVLKNYMSLADAGYSH